MKQQVVIIHGGDTFDTKEQYLDYLRTKPVSLEYFLPRADWKNSLPEKLGPDFQVLAPRLPDRTNAQYVEWKIWFERLVQFLEDGVILIGHSLGGIFLAKYLSENEFPKAIKATILVAPPHDDEDGSEPLGTFRLTGDLKRLQQQAGRLSFYFSNDDLVVTPYNMEKYKQALPEAKFHIFEDHQHFSQPEFPELVEEIKNITI